MSAAGLWTLCTVFTSALADAPAPVDGASWTELDKVHGIAVYTRSYEGSTYPEVRASGTVCATLPQLVAFVEDVAAFDQWIPDTAEARLLDSPAPRMQIYYIRTSMPWPVKDRDMIYRLSESAVFGHGGPNDSSLNTAISVAIEGLPDYLPIDARAMRMKGVIGSLDVRSDGRPNAHRPRHAHRTRRGRTRVARASAHRRHADQDADESASEHFETSVSCSLRKAPIE